MPKDERQQAARKKYSTKAAVFNWRPYRAHRPWPRPASVGGSRTKRPATGSCGLHSPSPLAGAAPNRPGGFALRRPQFPTAGRIDAQRPPAAASVRGWNPHRTPGNWKLRASLAKPPSGGCTQPPPAVSPPEGRSFQLPAVSRPTSFGRPASVGGIRTERPATGSCGLHLPSPLAGAAINRRRRFRKWRPQFSTAGRPGAQRPSAAAIVHGWNPHRTPGNWTLQASFAKPPRGGCD